MKANIVLLLTASFAAGHLKQATDRHKIPETATNANIFTTQQSTCYGYDSVKVVSDYKFDYKSSITTEAYARVTYPVFADNSLNELIRTAVLAPLKVKYQFQNSFAAEHPALSSMSAANNPARDYQELAANFIRQFETEAPKLDLKAYWYADIKVKVLNENSNYISMVCEKDYFTGGSHDLYDHLYLNYDRHIHQLIALNAQLKPGNTEKLKTIAEKIFRKNEGLNPTQTLEGYFFKNNRFDLPSNFAVTGKGLLFFYDYYEIKPFAAGTTQLIIPYGQLSELILPGSVLAGQAKRH